MKCSRVWLCFGLIALSAVNPVHAVEYTITLLEPLPGGVDSRATGINELGQVVGYSTLDGSTNVGRARPVIWDSDGRPTELWTDPSFGGMPAGINSAGQVVGRYGSGSGTPLPGPGIRPGRGFIWDVTNGMRDIGSLGGWAIEANAINEAGQVAGSSITVSGQTHAYIWDAAGGMRDLGTLGGIESFGNAINNRGQVAGTSYLPDGNETAFLWDLGTGMRELPPPGGGGARALGMDDDGQVVGNSAVGAVLWDAAGESRILSTIGRTFGYGWDINNLGDVVGQSHMSGRPEAVLWDQINGLQFFGGLISPDSNWELQKAVAINDQRHVVGDGMLNGERRGFLMKPVPEPATILSVLFGLVCAACGIWKRRLSCRR